MGDLNKINMEPHNKSLVEELNAEYQEIILPVTVFMGIEAVLGFFGNLFIICVFVRRYHTCSFKYFVVCLALTDLMCTLTIMPGEIVNQLQMFVDTLVENCKIKSYFNIYTFLTEIFCLVLIAVDRYRKVCAPLRWQIQPRTAFILCFVINAIAAIIAIPVAIFGGIRRVPTVYKNTNITLMIYCEIDEKYLEAKGTFEYISGLHVIYILSFISLIILYILIARKLLSIRRGVPVIENVLLPDSSSTNKSTSEALTCLSADVIQSHSYLEASTSGTSSEQETRKRVSNCSNESPCVMDNEKETRLKSPENKRFSEQNDQNETSQCEITSDAEEKIPTNIMCNSTKDVTPTRQSQMIRMQHELVPKVNPTKSDKGLKQKTIAMLLLTLIFILTALVYRIMMWLITNVNVLQNLNLSHSERAVYFFFLRLYFINHVINPIVYYVLDTHFRNVTKIVFQTLLQPFIRLLPCVNSTTA